LDFLVFLLISLGSLLEPLWQGFCSGFTGCGSRSPAKGCQAKRLRARSPFFCSDWSRMGEGKPKKVAPRGFPTLTFCKKPPKVFPNPQFVPTPIPNLSRPVSLLAFLLWRRRAVRDGRRGAAGSVRTRTSGAGRRRIQSRAPRCGHRRVFSVRVAGRPADGFLGCTAGRRRSSPRHGRGGMARLPQHRRPPRHGRRYMELLPRRRSSPRLGHEGTRRGQEQPGRRLHG
jgi:hypothetical protein